MKNNTILFFLLFLGINISNCQIKEEKPLYKIYNISDKGDTKYGYMNNHGEVIIKPKFDQVYDFKNNLAIVILDDKKRLINKEEEFLTSEKYVDLYHYENEKLIYFEINNKAGFMNEKGEIIVKPKQVIIDGFNNGLIKTRVVDEYGYRYSYVDKKGDIVIKPSSNYLSPFDNGVAFFGRYDNYRLINLKGKIVNKLIFQNHNNFSEGLASVSINNKWGYINTKGKIVIEPQFDNIGDFNQGMAYVQINNKFGYINKKGQVVIEPQFGNAGDFNEDLAPIKIKHQYGYIDKKGNIVIPVKFGAAEKFVNGFARVKKDNQHWAIINTKGEYIYNPINFLSISNFKNNLALVRYKKSYGYIDEKGNFVYTYGDKNDLKIIEK